MASKESFFKKKKKMKHHRKSVELVRGLVQSAANMQGGVFIRVTLTGAPLLQ